MKGQPRRRSNPARRLAFRVLRAVNGHGAYANLELARELREAKLDRRDAAFATELVAGTCRLMGTYDRIIAAASGRAAGRFDDDVLDVLRLEAHQLLSMRVPAHAAVASSVDVAALEIGERVAGLVNAIGRKIAAHDLDGWLGVLAEGLDERDALALRTHHPRWIVDALADVLSSGELEAALLADNVPPLTHLATRPGLGTRDELAGAGAELARYSPYGAYTKGAPGDLAAVREGRAGVQDEGSQLVALALARVEVPDGPWLDVCAGPGGKAALLGGLAIEQGSFLLAGEAQPHRAELVAQAVRGYTGPHRPVVVVADGTHAPYRAGSYARVLADVPCTGLGALRRRPEARWRRVPGDLDALVRLQKKLLRAALEATMPGGVVAYVTCSPHRAETVEVLESGDLPGFSVLRAADYLPEVPDTTRDDKYVQLWPHRHGTDAMFLALLRRDDFSV